MANPNVYRLVTNLKYWLVAGAAVAVGSALLWASGASWLKGSPSLATLANQMGGLVIASVALATIWDLVGRRSFFAEMLEVLNLKHDVAEAGLATIGTDYTRAIDWNASLKSATSLDIFAMWANTWRNTHHSALQELARRPDSKIRVFLPDPHNSNDMKTLASRFNSPSADVRRKLLEAISEYKALDQNSHSGRVEIYTTTAFRSFTAYRIDKLFIVTLYRHAGSRSPSVPVLTCREGGSLHSFFKEDLEGVANASTKHYP